ncbi:hypothetical protein HMPREF9997_00662 [Corynebacterium durum F0235]|uniref:Uncharacterized protein n=1 Tax=Corynebacterium durum F0235 TaxID=1035195 RepID=L1MJW9_9CORY|nr:hypothetical protein HMPREF9997_00662 [Corynebacterium durum F0235]
MQLTAQKAVIQLHITTHLTYPSVPALQRLGHPQRAPTPCILG